MKSWQRIEPLGLGVSADIGSIEPDYRSLLDGPDRIEYLNVGIHYTQIERARHFLGSLVPETPMVFHPLNFNTALATGEDVQVVRRTQEIIEYLGAKWAGQDIAIWMIDDVYQDAFLVPPILDDRSVEEVSAKAVQLDALLPCPFLLENPPFAFSVESMHLLDFMGEVSMRSDTGIVLDIGHLITYQAASGRELDDIPWSRFPLERVVEVHLAGLDDGRAATEALVTDRHDLAISEETWAIFEQLVPKMPNLRGVTLEQEFCPDALVRSHVKRAREALASHGAFA